MKVYEITYITLDELKKSPVSEAISALGGKVLHESSLGQKQFAYPIKKEVRGFYTSYIFEIEAEKVVELDRKISLHEEILRHLLIKFEGSLENLKNPTAKKTEEDGNSKPEVVKEVTDLPVEETVVKAVEKPIVTEKIETPTETPKKEEVKVVEIEKPIVVEEKKEVIKEEPIKVVRPKPVKHKKMVIEEPENEEERLKALDKKLDELLKD